jgi:hypothetical protein
MDCRKPEHKDVIRWSNEKILIINFDITVHGFWISAIPAEMTMFKRFITANAEQYPFLPLIQLLLLAFFVG